MAQDIRLVNIIIATRFFPLREYLKGRMTYCIYPSLYLKVSKHSYPTFWEQIFLLENPRRWFALWENSGILGQKSILPFDFNGKQCVCSEWVYSSIVHRIKVPNLGFSQVAPSGFEHNTKLSNPILFVRVIQLLSTRLFLLSRQVPKVVEKLLDLVLRSLEIWASILSQRKRVVPFFY